MSPHIRYVTLWIYIAVYELECVEISKVQLLNGQNSAYRNHCEAAPPSNNPIAGVRFSLYEL